MLTKHGGTTKDTRGTEFSYTCYTTKERMCLEDADGKYRFQDVVEREYVCQEFPEMAALSLKDLKQKMGNK